jgi:tetratricopeptide (TPR) repeat protein
MNTLIIHHRTGLSGKPAQVNIEFCPEDEAPCSAPSTDFAFAASSEELQLLQWYWEQYESMPWNEATRARHAEAALRDLGQRLFGQVFTGPARDLYLRAARAFDHCRIVIQADSAEGFALPWEWMLDSSRGEFGFLAGAVHDLVRRIAGWHPAGAPLPGVQTLNVLVILAIKPIPRPVGVAKDPAEPVENLQLISTVTRGKPVDPSCDRSTSPAPGPEAADEWISAIRPLLDWARPHRHRLRMDVLVPATAERLQEVLRQRPGFYQVAHLEGLPLAAESGCLPCCLPKNMDPAGPSLSFQELVRMLRESGIQFVVVNSACRGRPDPVSCFAKAGFSALSEGLWAALTYPFATVPNQTLMFFRRFYEALINGDTFGRAVRLGQEELRLHPSRWTVAGELDLLDWGLPAAFEQVPSPVLPKPHAPHRLSGFSPMATSTPSETEIDCPPPPVFGLLGRHAELSALGILIARQPVIVIQGPAGVGKTELAVHFARWLALNDAFDGPILLITAYPGIAADVVYDRVGQLFEDRIGEEKQLAWPALQVSERRAFVLDLMRQIPVLMILDHFPPLSGWTEDPGPNSTAIEEDWIGLFQALSGGRSRLLITSRIVPRWLSQNAATFKLDGLSAAASQEFAVRVLQSSSPRPAKVLTSISELMRLLDGNPLALQIALPMLHRTSPDKLQDAISQASTRLHADCRTLLGTSLASVVQHRIDSLDPAFCGRLGLLGLFQGCVSARVLAAICWQNQAPPLLEGMGRDDWQRCLESAAELGLLRRRSEASYLIPPALEPFFRMLFETHLGAHRAWAEAAFAAAYGRAGNQLYAIYQADAELALSMLRSEELNFRACYLLTRRHQWWDDLKENLCGLRTLLISAGCWTEWERLIAPLEQEIMRAAPGLKPAGEILWLRLLGHRAEICEHRRDDAALLNLRQQLADFCQTPVPAQPDSDLLQELGLVTLGKGYYDEAERFFQKSLVFKQRQGDELGQAALCENLARTAKLQKHYRDAKRWFESARQIAAQLGSAQTEAAMLFELGLVDQERGELEEARDHFLKARTLFETLGCHPQTASILHQLGRISQTGRQFDQAEQFYLQSLAIKDQLGDELGRARSLHQLGNLAFYQRQYAQADRHYLQALSIRQRLGEPDVRAQTLYRLGNNAFMLEQFEQAMDYYQRSLALRLETDDVRSQARLLSLLGKVSMALGRPDEAHHYYERAEALFDQLKILVE